MKHPWQVTLLLVLLFVVAQVVGLFLVAQSISSVQIIEGQPVLQHTTTAIGERPQLHGYESFLYLFFGVLIGTVLLLILTKFRRVNLWKAWFGLAVFLTVYISLGVIFPVPQVVIGFLSFVSVPPIRVIAILLALPLAVWKVYKPNPWVHNLTEVLMYAGIAVLLVPIFDVFWMLMLLLAISLYDMIAVWRTKHMVALAQFQAGSSVFAGLMVPKGKKGGFPPRGRTNDTRTKMTATATSKRNKPTGDLQPPKGAPIAILGGGDIAFPLLFSGAVLESLVRRGFPVPEAFASALIVTLTATVALALLFIFSKKGRFYPAMPFLSLGCVAGWLLTLLL